MLFSISLSSRLKPSKTSVAALAVALACVALVAVEAQTAPSTVNPPADAAAKAEAGVVVATVNDKPIYKADVDRQVEAVLKVQKIDAAKLPEVQAAVLQQMIGNIVLNNYMLSQKDLVSRGEITAAINEFRKSLLNQNITFEAFLASRNTTEQAFMSEVAGTLMIQKCAAAIATDEGLKQFFEEHKENFDGTVRRVSHVLLRPEGSVDEAAANELLDQAKAIREQLQSGQLKFDEAATKYSAGPSRQHGGDLGFVPPGVMDINFTKAAYSLKLDEVSEPVGTPFGIHLIKVTEIKAGTKTLDDVKQAVQKAYYQSLINKLMEDQTAAAKIEFAGNYPHFKPGTEEVVLPGQAATP